MYCLCTSQFWETWYGRQLTWQEPCWDINLLKTHWLALVAFDCVQACLDGRYLMLGAHVVLPESLLIPRYFVQQAHKEVHTRNYRPMGFYANIVTCQMEVVFVKHVRFSFSLWTYPCANPPTPGVNGRAESIQATRLFFQVQFWAEKNTLPEN